MGSCSSKQQPENKASKAGKDVPKADDSKKDDKKEVQAPAGGKLRFSYFPLQARGLAVLLTLSEYDQDYEANVVTMDKWPAVKESGVCPFGQLPILETPDVGVIGQAYACQKYLAERSGKAPECIVEKTRSDMVAALAQDIFSDVFPVHPHLLEPDRPAGPVKEMFEGPLAGRLASLEKFIEGKDRFTKSGVSPGELMLFSVLVQVVAVKGDLLDATPNVKAYYTRTHDLPSVQKVLTGKSPFGEVPAFLTPVKEQ